MLPLGSQKGKQPRLRLQKEQMGQEDGSRLGGASASTSSTMPTHTWASGQS